MKLMLIPSHVGKSLIFSVFVSLFTLGASNIFSQSVFSAPDSIVESPPKTSRTSGNTLENCATAADSDVTGTDETDGKNEKKSAESETRNEKITVKIERFNTFYEVKNKMTAGEFRDEQNSEKQIESLDLTSGGKAKNRFRRITETKNRADDSANNPPFDENFRWRAAIGQSLMFLGIQHGYAFTQLKTRRSLKGKFWKDYVQSVKNLRGWDDGGRFFTNYIAHPMQGSLTGFIFVQNDPKGRKAEFGASGDYWKSRMKAMLWTTAWSTQFEIGPISQASIGNVGLSGKQTWEDIVTTPTLGTAMLIGEDAIDRFVIKNIERRTDNFYIKVFVRMLLNPTRNFSNMLRFKAPWHRDRPPAR